MTRLSTLPSHREQTYHALVLLGVPAPARLVVDVHSALFDGDLSVPALTALLRDEQRRRAPGTAVAEWGAPVEQDGGKKLAMTASAFQWAADQPPAGPEAPATAEPGDRAGRPGGTGGRPYVICPGLQPDLTPARGIVTLSTWPVEDRICTPAVARAEALVVTVRVAEFVAMRPGACAMSLMRQLAEAVPGGPEAADPGAVAEGARAALADPALAAAVAAEAPLRAAAAERAGRLDEAQRLFGIPGLPQQRGGA